MSELYRKEKGNEAGLGDLVLEAYDRTAAITGQRLVVQRERDPNADRTDPMDFTLTRAERAAAQAGVAARQGCRDGLLGDVVRAVPCAASAL